MGQIRQLKVEDLLAREPVGLDYAPIRQFLEGKRVVVTGAGGSIGAELCRQIAAARPASLVLLDRYENSLFHIHNELAKGLGDVELHPVVANITDARRIHQVFEAVQRWGVERFVLISTDKAVNPTERDGRHQAGG